MSLSHFRFTCEPVPEEAAVVRAPNVRFTVLTSRLIRLEYTSTGKEFEDRPSQAFWYRRQPVPDFQVRQSEEQIEIETKDLLLRYHHNTQGFTPSSLSIPISGKIQRTRF